MAIYKTLIKLIITYGSDCWMLKNTDVLSLGVYEKKISRRMFGGNRISEYEYKK